MSALAAVARIAYLASDVIVDSKSTSTSGSQFLDKYGLLKATSRTRLTTVVSIPHGADPGSTLLSTSQASHNLVSYTAVVSSQTVTGLILPLSELGRTPTVLHFAVKDDLSDVLLLRSAVPFFLVSSTAQQAHDHALLASRLARAETKAVIHVFYEASRGETLDEVSEERVQAFLQSDKTLTNGHVNGQGAILNGKENGDAEADSTLLQLYKLYEAASLSTVALTRRALRPLMSSGPSEPHTVVFALGNANFNFALDGVSFVNMSLVNPLPPFVILGEIPKSVERVIVLEHVIRWTMKWTPLFLEVTSALQQRDSSGAPVVQSGVLGDVSNVGQADVLKLIQQASSSAPTSRLTLGTAVSAEAQTNGAPHVPKHESSYTKILSHLFGDRLEIANAPSLVNTQGHIATSPEYALGRVRAHIDERNELVNLIQELLVSKGLDSDLHSLLSQWLLAKDDGAKSAKIGAELAIALEGVKASSTLVARILALRAHLPARSRWIVGSDAWSYDIGASGLHHAVASGLNVNLLLLDTLPYSARTARAGGKRDAGLYAMNHGAAYVASVAVYSSYSQVLQALAEADRYPGPSVVLAYLPYTNEGAPALEVLKETKLAVDAGYWPLYRWDPSKERVGREPFSLDSDAVKNDLRQFLDRQNHLSQLTRATPQFASELVSSLGENLKEARRKRAQAAYNDLVTALDAPPLLILYASDGGAAEKKAKRLAARGKARGLNTTLATMDSTPLDSLAQEEYVAFITSTAGQGEPPQNGRNMFKALNAAAARGEKLFPRLRFTVFGMGDSHYWPRPEDAHYYNKPGKDLNTRLEQLGGERVAELGLGDDQDADGPETGYREWEPLLWKVLGVDSVEVTEAEPEPITNEHIKAASGYLRGTIVEGLEDTTTGALAASDTQLTKFHGIYQQDDRDIREEREAAGAEPAYAFMIRVRMPGGVCTPEQWLAMDQIADEHGCGTFKITTRATFQFHGVIKRHLKPSIQAINRALLDTLAACGDVNRNVICSSIPSMSKLHSQVYKFSKAVSEHLLPRTTAYHEIWLDKKMVAGEAVKDFEPLYGEFYLPRKFKVAVAVPPTNDVDIFANDLGFIAITDARGELSGFDVTVGGGMGVTHGNKKTYPRTADVIGFCTPEQGPKVAEAVMLTQRDNGNRVDRKNARLKYTIDRMGLDAFKAEVEKRLGYSLSPARPYVFDRNIDDFGWHTAEDGKHHFMMFIENGRIQDEPGKDFKTGLREIAKVHKGTFRLTANQHLMLSDVPPEDLEMMKGLLARYRLNNLSQTGLRLSSSACVAFPTCGLAMAESERYLPILIDKVEKICEKNGLRNDSIVMRMTGCPNGCARPYLAEVAFVGKAPGSYLMLLGGGYYGQRLNKIYRETVSEPEILAILEPMIKRYALERLQGERFGDFVIRVGYIAPTTSGAAWYDRMGGEGQYREVAA